MPITGFAVLCLPEAGSEAGAAVRVGVGGNCDREMPVDPVAVVHVERRDELLNRVNDSSSVRRRE